MDVLKYFVNLYRNECEKYCDELFEHHIDNILSTGLILDEDMEIFVAHWDDKHNNANNIAVQTYCLYCSIPILCCALLRRRFIISKKLIILSFIPLTSFGISKLYISTSKYKCTNNIENLTGNLLKIYKLNQTVLAYLKVRKSVSSTGTDNFTPYSKCVAEFMDMFFKSEEKLLNLLRENIKNISCLLPLLKDEYIYLNNIDFNFHNDCTNIENTLSQTQKVCHMYILITSNLLCSLGLTFCKKLWKRGTDIYMDIQNLVNTLNEELSSHYKTLKFQFDKARYSVETKQEKQRVFKRNKFVSSKLEQSLIDAITNLNIILEKSRFIMNKLEKVENEQDFKNLGDNILDLRNHSFGCYESLDILCKLYEVLLRTALVRKKNDVIEEVQKVINLEEKDANALIIKFDDPGEPAKDEEYELYIGEDEDTTNEPTSRYYEDDSGQYLYLMLQELKQSLKEHKSFIAAREKRGIIEPELLQREKKKSLKLDSIPIDIKCKEIVDLPVPPAPPLPQTLKPPLSKNKDSINRCLPPPPSVFRKDIHSVSDGNLLDSIKSISKQRKQVEEFFGDSSSEGEST